MTSERNKAKRRQPWQFSVATLLLLMTMVAVAFGWWLDRQRLIGELRKAEAVAAERETRHARELSRMEARVKEVQGDLASKTAEAKVYLQTIEELAKKQMPE